MQDPNSAPDAILTDMHTDAQTNIESVIHQDELQTMPTEAVVSRANGSADKGRVKVPATNGNGNGSPNGNSNGSGKQSNFRLNNAPGLTMERRFTKPGEDVYSTVEWEIRSAVIANERGEKVFEQTGVEIPKSWTQLATNVVVSKYFRGHIGTPEREHSVRQLISRVADTIAVWGRKMDYFATETDAQAFQDELTHILLHQKAAFNSPVWFNVGLADQPVPQASACQPYHARVLTQEGLVSIGDIVTQNRTGLQVFDGDGLTPVVAVKSNGRKQVYRIELNDGYQVEATADHLVCAHQERRAKRLEWRRVDELAVGMKMRVYPHAARTHVAATSAVEVSEAALAGWLQAEGFVGQYATGTNRSLTLEFMTNGEEEHKWVLDHLDVVFPNAHFKIRDVETQDADMRLRRVRLYGEHLRPFVQKYDLLTRGVNMRVPAVILTAPDEAVIAYLSSVYQSEGYVSFNGTATHVAMAVISQEWARDIQVLLSRLGIYTRRSSKREARTDRYDTHVLDIALLSERAKFAQCVGFISQAKSVKLLQSLGNKGKRCPDIRYSAITSIEPMGEMDVYDIQTGSGQYLSEGVLVHNCFINGVEDTMESILTLAKTEGMLFKYGSGTGTNLSTIRGSNEPLRGGGTASGPLSFMRGFDQLAGAVKSGGKCFKKGTLVAAPEGWLPIETLQVGDMVLTHKGPRPVADFMPNGWKPCYKVTTEEGYEIEVTQGHKFAFWNVHGGRFDVKPIEDFLEGEAMYILLEASEGGTTIPLVTPEANDPAHATTTAEMNMPVELNDKMGYMLGLMYGDAELRTEYPYRVRVAFCKDKAGDASLARFRQYSKDVFGEEPLLLGDHEGHQQIGFTRKRMVEFLAANGLAKGKANNLGFPKMLFQARPEVRAAFLAGYIDADGSYQKRGGWQISSVDRPFLVELQRLLLTFGVPSKLKLNREAQGRWQVLYRLHIVGHTFIARLVERILPYSAKAAVNYTPSDGADKGWGYRPSLYAPLKSRLEGRGGHGLMERKITSNETTGYRGLVATIEHPHAAISDYAEELSHCVQVHLASVELTEMADTYDIEVTDVHLLSANGFYASNTRRAAKMALLDITHPDVEAFIVSKADEEKKAHALIDAGYSGAFNVAGGAYDSVLFQNGNHSVRVTDTFMQTYLANGEWTTRNVTDGKPNRTYKAADLMNKIGASAWVCGDPGMQYDTTINKWHTCKNSDKINASNPCSEFVFLDNTACNLSSLNLMKFRTDDGEFDVAPFLHACRVMITAQEILVDNASYPTPRIQENSHDYRPLGLGYANLGALLMARGVPYDSDAGRAYAGAITALMTGEAYHQSAVIARDHGWAFPGYKKNREPMLDVMRMHREAVETIDGSLVPAAMLTSARQCWNDAIHVGNINGYRNAQSTVLAPTGTIGFLMDCDTTGIEPDIAIVKYKSLVGGGMMKIVNNTVPEALSHLGYTPSEAGDILAYIDANDTIEGAPLLKPEHLPIFDCAFKPGNGERSIHYMGHVRMMAAAQPFLSGAISKTVNMPTDATAEDITGVYVEGWRLGLKAIAIYRDGSKRTQPLNTKRADTPKEKEEKAEKAAQVAPAAVPAVVVKPLRRKLPDERAAVTHKFSIAGHEGYITVGMYPDGTPGEIFLTMSKEGSTISGLMDSFATAISLALQYGVPLPTLVDKFAHARFEPSGVTNNPDIRFAKSIMDYIFRWLGSKFLNRVPEATQPTLSSGHTEENGAGEDASLNVPRLTLTASPPDAQMALEQREHETFQNQADAPICTECGSLMVRNGACFKCLNCGSVFGCS